MYSWLLPLVLGILAGTLSGFLGIGGGTILIPALAFLYGLTQHQAQGTTLAVMVFPIGLLAALKYYVEGNVKVSLVAFICIGFFLGGFLGALFAHKVNDLILRKIFGAFLLLVAIKMIIK